MVCVWGMGYKTHTRRYMLYMHHTPHFIHKNTAESECYGIVQGSEGCYGLQKSVTASCKNQKTGSTCIYKTTAVSHPLLQHLGHHNLCSLCKLQSAPKMPKRDGVNSHTFGPSDQLHCRPCCWGHCRGSMRGTRNHTCRTSNPQVVVLVVVLVVVVVVLVVVVVVRSRVVVVVAVAAIVGLLLTPHPRLHAPPLQGRVARRARRLRGERRGVPLP